VARDTAAAAGLPTLVGSEKQITWAETIRAGMIRDTGRLLVAIEQEDPEIADMARGADAANLTQVGVIADRCLELDADHPHGLFLVAYCQAIRTRTQAKWWIDNRTVALRGLPDILERDRLAAEAALAKQLEVDEVNEFREQIRERINALFPAYLGWEMKVGTWSGCKRVYFGRGFGKNLATFHVTGDRRNSPGSLEKNNTFADEKVEPLREILADVAAKWAQLVINDTRKPE
jgi:hypothetical protein